MGRFSELNTNTDYISRLLLQNQNLLKLIAYDDSNPLSLTPVVNPNSLLFNRIFPQPKSVDAIKEQQTILTYIFSDAKLFPGNLKFKGNKLIFNIICHINLWKVKGGIRPYLISEEIDNVFNELRGTKLSIGKVLLKDWIYREYSSYFCGYLMIYDIVSFN